MLTFFHSLLLALEFPRLVPGFDLTILIPSGSSYPLPFKVHIPALEIFFRFALKDIAVYVTFIRYSDIQAIAFVATRLPYPA
jgi:hypothetical protein